MEGPHVDAVILDIAPKAAAPFLAASWTCSLHWSFGSTHTPSTRMLVLRRVASSLSILTVDARSSLACRLFRVKCMSWYLSGAKVAPCLLAHAAHLSWAIVRRSQFSAAVFPQVTRFVSSTKPNASVSPWARRKTSSSSDKKQGIL